MPVFCCCQPATCQTTIAVNFLDLAGQTKFPCGGPGDVFYAVTGTTNDNKPVALSGQTAVAAPTWNLVLVYYQNQLPAGNYSLRVYTKSAVCGQPYGADGRFDGTWSFAVTCPKTSLTYNLQSKFDVTTIVSNFGLRGCGVYWYLDGLPVGLTLGVAASATGSLNPCRTQVLPYYNLGQIAGNVAVTYKLTDYDPFTVTFTATHPDCITSTEVRSYTSCGSYTNDWTGGDQSVYNPTGPYIFYALVPLAAYSGCNGYRPQYHMMPLEGASVACTGGLTVSGTTQQQGYQGNSTVPRWAYARASDYKYPKAGVTVADMVWTWTVSYDRYFRPQTYNSSDYDADFRRQVAYGGTTCPLGGDLGDPIDSKACCGCPLPANKTLHASALGQQFDITWDGYQWSGFFAADLHALTCPPPGGKQTPTEGQVTCHLYFEYLAAFPGSNSFRPFLTLQYASTGGNGPTLCPRTQPPANTNNAGWDLFEGDQSYGSPTYQAICPPSFYAEQHYTGTYGVNRMDGTGIYDYYDVDIDVIITE